MYDRDRDEEEAFEIDPHELEKNRREQRIKGKKKDKGKANQFDGIGKKPRKQKGSRRREKEALREMTRDYR